MSCARSTCSDPACSGSVTQSGTSLEGVREVDRLDGSLMRRQGTRFPWNSVFVG